MGFGHGRVPTGALTQADEPFDGQQAASQPEREPEGQQFAPAQPEQHQAIDADPLRLSHDDTRPGGRLGRKTQMEEINDGQGCAGQRQEKQREERPARPDQRLGEEDQRGDAAPADEDEEEAGEDEWAERCRFRTLNELYSV